MSNVEIKPYNDCYKEQIIELILKIQVNEFKIPLSLEDQPDLENIADFYQKKNGNFWVALDGGKVIGTIALIDIRNSQAALRKMFVAQEYRGRERGVAQTLLDTLLLWSQEKKINEIYLGTIAIYFAAQRFYEKNGFREISKAVLPASFPIMQIDSKFYLYEVIKHAKN